MSLREQVVSERLIAEALDEQKERLTKEFERIQQIANITERTAHMTRMHIIEDILTLRCPRCKTAFMDFDGCFALTCGKNSCHAGFCAWCLKDCGADAHSHVPACPENGNGGSVYGTEIQFKNHHQQRRERLVREVFGSQPKDVQDHLRLLLINDLRDLNIRL